MQAVVHWWNLAIDQTYLLKTSVAAFRNLQFSKQPACVFTIGLTQNPQTILANIWWLITCEASWTWKIEEWWSASSTLIASPRVVSVVPPSYRVSWVQKKNIRGLWVSCYYSLRSVQQWTNLQKSSFAQTGNQSCWRLQKLAYTSIHADMHTFT